MIHPVIIAWLKTIFRFTIPSWLGPAILYSLVSLFFVFVLKLGYDKWQSGREQVRQTTIGILKDANENMAQEIKREQASSQIDNKIVSDVLEAKEELSYAGLKAKDNKEQKIQKIEKKYFEKITKVQNNDPQKTAKTAKTVKQLENAEAVEISQAHIEHLWEVYCSATNADSSCVSSNT